MATTAAMESYMQLCGNELTNAARLKAYIDNGIFPSQFNFNVRGCEGLEAILPCADSDPPVGGYQLPELDPAPWYDTRYPESKNFAGLFVTEVTVSSPFSRSVTPNIGVGQTLGRLALNGRTITVHGFLVGKTCCANSYGLHWLTDLLAKPDCAGAGCTTCELDFLDCCPRITDEDECITTTDEDGHTQVFIRPVGDTEYQRGSDFFRRMNHVGLVTGPDIISRRGTSCGCGCSGIVEVEFVLASGSPYLNSFGEVLLDAAPPPDCPDEEDCQIVWLLGDDGPCVDPACPPAPDCLEDPQCPLPVLPRAGKPLGLGCGCFPFTSARLCTGVTSVRDWGESTINVEVYAGSSDMRNLAIRIWQDPLNLGCADEDTFPNCAACVTLLVSYVPAGGTLVFSGEKRTVTVTCNGLTRNAFQNVSAIDGQPFGWPDLSCSNICTCVTFDCVNVAPDARVTITRIDQDL